jgi:hypothetical protein
MKLSSQLTYVISACLCLAFVNMATSNVVAAERSSSASDSSNKKDKKTGRAEKSEVLYPSATRPEPKQEGATELQKLRSQMITAYEKKKDKEALDAAIQLKQDPKASAYDKAIATQILAISASNKDNDNHSEIIPLLEEVVELNALENDLHYSLMFELAQRHLMLQNYEDALDFATKFEKETKSEKVAIYRVKGNALYRLKKPKEAIVELEKVRAIDKSDAAITAMLARAYSDIGDTKKAAEIAKESAQSTGNDKASRLNLAITYRDAKDFTNAADVVDDLRKNNQLSEERDYLVAMNVYTGMKNREADTAAVMQEGLDKGVVKGTANHYNILAEAYYYSNLDNNITKAIAAWQKAAPLDKKGSTYLNLAIVHCQEQMWQACKTSAQKAIEKGGINAADAKQQINIADKELARK